MGLGVQLSLHFCPHNSFKTPKSEAPAKSPTLLEVIFCSDWQLVFVSLDTLVPSRFKSKVNSTGFNPSLLCHDAVCSTGQRQRRSHERQASLLIHWQHRPPLVHRRLGERTELLRKSDVQPGSR